MASLRSPWARGARAAAGSLVDSLNTVQADRREQAGEQRRASLQLSNAKDLAEFQFGLGEQGKISEFLRQLSKERDEKLRSLFDALKAPGDDPAALPTEDYLRNVGRSAGRGEEDIQTLIEQRTRLEEAANAARLRNRTEAFDLKEVIGEGGVRGFNLPDGTFVPTERTPEAEGDRAATVFDATTPGAIRRAAGEAAATAPFRESYVPGETEDGRPTTFGVTPGGAPRDLSTGPRSQGSGSGEGRVQGMRAQLEEFKKLSEQINTASPAMRIPSGAGKWVSQFFTQTAEDYERRRLPLALSLAVYIQGSRPTDTDARIGAMTLPDFFTSKPVAEGLLTTVEQILDNAVRANKAVGLDLENMTEEEIIQAARQGRFVQTGTFSDVMRLLQEARDRPPLPQQQPQSSTILDFNELMGR